jgi:hypothetical protein
LGVDADADLDIEVANQNAQDQDAAAAGVENQCGWPSKLFSPQANIISIMTNILLSQNERKNFSENFQ